jgi:hypothetical protein
VSVDVGHDFLHRTKEIDVQIGVCEDRLLGKCLNSRLITGELQKLRMDFHSLRNMRLLNLRNM